MFDNLFLDYEDIREIRNSFKTGPSSLLEQYRLEEALNRERFDQWMKETFFAESDYSKFSTVLRAILNHQAWHIALDQSGKPLLTTAIPDNFEYLPFTDLSGRIVPEITEAEAGKIKKHKAKKNQQPPKPLIDTARPLLTLNENPLEQGNTAQINGLELFNFIQENAAQIDGLLIVPASRSADEPLYLSSKYFFRLDELSQAMRLERALVKPSAAEEQVSLLLNARFWVEGRDGKASLNRALHSEAALIDAITSQEKCGMQVCFEMSGRELFQYVKENPSVDGIRINCIGGLDADGKRLNQMVLSLAQIHALLEGKDIRPGVRPLKARSIKELEFYLTQMAFPHKERKLIEAETPSLKAENKMLVRAMVPYISVWRQQETVAGQFEEGDEGITWSPVFEVPCNYKEVEGFGQGKSEILCPGHLVRELNALAMGAKDTDSNFKPGKNIFIGRVLDDYDRKQARYRIDVAKQLLQLMNANQDELPRQSVQTVSGASVFRKAPFSVKRDWIEASLKRAEKYQKAFVWGG